MARANLLSKYPAKNWGWWSRESHKNRLNSSAEKKTHCVAFTFHNNGIWVLNCTAESLLNRKTSAVSLRTNGNPCEEIACDAGNCQGERQLAAFEKHGDIIKSVKSQVPQLGGCHYCKIHAIYHTSFQPDRIQMTYSAETNLILWTIM